MSALTSNCSFTFRTPGSCERLATTETAVRTGAHVELHFLEARNAVHHLGLIAHDRHCVFLAALLRT
jgi:hypothetical protein